MYLNTCNHVDNYQLWYELNHFSIVDYIEHCFNFQALCSKTISVIDVYCKPDAQQTRLSGHAKHEIV